MSRENAENLEESREFGPVWSVVANIVLERPYGPGGKEIRQGTRKFRPGSKVVIVRFRGSHALVAGHHRVSGGLIASMVAYEHLVNWRAELTYSPKVIEMVEKEWTPSSDYNCSCGDPCCNETCATRDSEILKLYCSGSEESKMLMHAMVNQANEGGWAQIVSKIQPFVSTRTTRHLR
jgi:hypothetical protein